MIGTLRSFVVEIGIDVSKVAINTSSKKYLHFASCDLQRFVFSLRRHRVVNSKRNMCTFFTFVADVMFFPSSRVVPTIEDHFQEARAAVSCCCKPFHVLISVPAAR